MAEVTAQVRPRTKGNIKCAEDWRAYMAGRSAEQIALQKREKDLEAAGLRQLTLWARTGKKRYYTALQKVQDAYNKVVDRLIDIHEEQKAREGRDGGL